MHNISAIISLVMIFVNVAKEKGVNMNHERLNEFSKITACIGSCMDGLLQAQEMLVELMCKYCDIPLALKPQMIEDMNKVMGIKIERIPT